MRPRDTLPPDAVQALNALGQVDIVVGIPSFNNARTIGHVVEATHAGLAKYFPRMRTLIVNSDGGSTDGTQGIVTGLRMPTDEMLLISASGVSREPDDDSLSRDSGKGERVPVRVRGGGAAGCRGVRGGRFRPQEHQPRVGLAARRAHPGAWVRLRGAFLLETQVRRHDHQQHRLPGDARPVRPAGAPAHRRRFRRVRAARVSLPHEACLGLRCRAVRHRHLDDDDRHLRPVSGGTVVPLFSPGDLRALGELALQRADAFEVPDDLWVRIVYDLAAAYHHRLMDRQHLIRSSLPLYLGRVASFVREVADLDAPAVEERLERLCERFEAAKPYLLDRWRSPGGGREPAAAAPSAN